MRTGRAVAVAALATVTMVAATGASNARPDAGSLAGRCPGFGKEKPPPRTISKIQAIQFDLMRRSSFNAFNGFRVARDLLQHRRLWCGAIIDRLGDWPLIKLRDIGANEWNVDTLYVLSSGANDRSLSSLTHHWHADEVRWITGKAASDLLGTSEPLRILRVWWD